LERLCAELPTRAYQQNCPSHLLLQGVVAYFSSESEHGWLIFKIYSGKIHVQVDGENSESLLPSFMA
jgi:hypothetical protein